MMLVVICKSNLITNPKSYHHRNRPKLQSGVVFCYTTAVPKLQQYTRGVTAAFIPIPNTNHNESLSVLTHEVCCRIDTTVVHCEP